MQILEDLNVSRVLAIFAHPDDAEAACGGTLAKFAAQDISVNLLTLAKGDKGKGETLDRENESKRACEILGLSSAENLGFADGEFVNDLDLRELLTNKIRTYKPDLIICPDPTAVFFSFAYINHRDHRETGWAVLDVVSGAVSNPKYFPSLGSHVVGHLLCAGTLEPNCVVDIENYMEKKIDAVLCYDSQIADNSGDLSKSIQDSASKIGKLVDLKFGEAFRYSSLANVQEQM